jgi:hypothetical protein
MMFFSIPNIRIRYKQDGQLVTAEAVCLMDWPAPDGTFSNQYQLLVVHKDDDPIWLDVRETTLFSAIGHWIVPVHKLLKGTDRDRYLYHAQKQATSQKRAFWNTLGRKRGKHVLV